ncbi:MAG: threonine synthase [Bacteroidota bacterium]
MKFYSTNRNTVSVSFREALFRGLAPDGGLYFPETIPPLPAGFFRELPHLSLPEIGTRVVANLVQEEVPEAELARLMAEVLNFPIPLVEVEADRYSLELFHGPTRSFKDVGARFMSRMMGWFNQGAAQEVTVLVATSGDTGSAVANGFLGVPGVRVVLLYPSGMVSQIQEMQLTTLGQNVTALEVAGVFDDCQAMVKAAFVDPEITARVRLTSANSINIGRLIPQSIYYYHALAQLPDAAPAPVICVPSGNFGNLCGGLIAWKTGLPVRRFIAATNANAVVPEYLASGEFQPRATVRTLSNAMDVGNPSNFARMLELFGGQVTAMRKMISGHGFGDRVTMDALAEVKDRTRYLMDPHGAVGFLGLDAEDLEPGVPAIFLETAHPAKFAGAIEDKLGETVPLPDDLAACLTREKQAISIGNTPADLKEFLLRSGPG